MAAMSDFLEAALAEPSTRDGLPSGPDQLLRRPCTQTATDERRGGTELTGNGYARVAVSPAAGSWAAPGAGGNTTNAVEIAFPAATGSPWSTATHFAILDASSGGNRYYHGALTASQDGGGRGCDPVRHRGAVDHRRA